MAPDREDVKPRVVPDAVSKKRASAPLHSAWQAPSPSLGGPAAVRRHLQMDHRSQGSSPGPPLRGAPAAAYHQAAPEEACPPGSLAGHAHYEEQQQGLPQPNWYPADARGQQQVQVQQPGETCRCDCGCSDELEVPRPSAFEQAAHAGMESPPGHTSGLQMSYFLPLRTGADRRPAHGAFPSHSLAGDVEQQRAGAYSGRHGSPGLAAPESPPMQNCAAGPANGSPATSNLSLPLRALYSSALAPPDHAMPADASRGDARREGDCGPQSGGSSPAGPAHLVQGGVSPPKDVSPDTWNSLPLLGSPPFTQSEQVSPKIMQAGRPACPGGGQEAWASPSAGGHGGPLVTGPRAECHVQGLGLGGRSLQPFMGLSLQGTGVQEHGAFASIHAAPQPDGDGASCLGLAAGVRKPVEGVSLGFQSNLLSSEPVGGEGHRVAHGSAMSDSPTGTGTSNQYGTHFGAELRDLGSHIGAEQAGSEGYHASVDHEAGPLVSPGQGNSGPESCFPKNAGGDLEKEGNGKSELSFIKLLLWS